MKSVVSEKKVNNDTRTYPYIGVWPDGDMVLFSAPKTGTWIYQNSTKAGHQLGDYRNDWAESGTKLYTGSVTLSND